MSKKQTIRCSLVSKIVSSPLIFDLALGVLIVLAFALYQEAPSGTWALIRRILGR